MNIISIIKEVCDSLVGVLAALAALIGAIAALINAIKSFLDIRKKFREQKQAAPEVSKPPTLVILFKKSTFIIGVFLIIAAIGIFVVRLIPLSPSPVSSEISLPLYAGWKAEGPGAQGKEKAWIQGKSAN